MGGFLQQGYSRVKSILWHDNLRYKRMRKPGTGGLNFSGLPAGRESENIARVAPVYGHRRSALAGIYWRIPYRTDGDRRGNCARTLVGLCPSHDAAHGARDVTAGSPPAHRSRRAVPLLERKVRGPACRAVVRLGDAERRVRGRVSCRWHQPALLEGDIRGFLDVFRRVALAQDGQRARGCRSNHGERCLIAGCNFSECLPSAKASGSWPGCWGSAGAPCWCRCWSCCSTSNSTGRRGRAWWRSCRPPALSLFWCTTKPARSTYPTECFSCRECSWADWRAASLRKNFSRGGCGAVSPHCCSFWGPCQWSPGWGKRKPPVFS